MHDVFAVAQHLHLQMARALEETFQIERAAAEGGLGLGLRGVKLTFEARLVVGDADAAAAAPALALSMTGKPICGAAASA